MMVKKKIGKRLLFYTTVTTPKENTLQERLNFWCSVLNVILGREVFEVPPRSEVYYDGREIESATKAIYEDGTKELMGIKQGVYVKDKRMSLKKNRR